MRPDGRRPDELREVTIVPDVNRYAEGSVEVSFGHTKVLCTASVDSRVPAWLEGQGKGWVTAEYAMLPRATHTRSGRSGGGRGQEIQRLVGRALRAAVDLQKLGPRQITIDCDVLQADGGTRTAAITGGYVALVLALRRLQKSDKVPKTVVRRAVSAVSCGLVDGEARLDLAYEEDSKADADVNFVLTDEKTFVEIQGTAEARPFSADEYARLCVLAERGARELFAIQAEALARAKPGK